MKPLTSTTEPENAGGASFPLLENTFIEQPITGVCMMLFERCVVIIGAIGRS